jgi:hypothetical protein
MYSSGGPGEENILAEIPQVLQALVDDADIAPHVLEREVGGRGVIGKHMKERASAQAYQQRPFGAL